MVVGKQRKRTKVVPVTEELQEDVEIPMIELDVEENVLEEKTYEYEGGVVECGDMVMMDLEKYAYEDLPQIAEVSAFYSEFLYNFMTIPS